MTFFDKYKPEVFPKIEPVGLKSHLDLYQSHVDRYEPRPEPLPMMPDRSLDRRTQDMVAHSRQIWNNRPFG